MMTSEWFDARPVEDWDFNELHDCLREALSERDEARAVAQEYYRALRQLEGDYQWEKHYARDPEMPGQTWLQPVEKLGPPKHGGLKETPGSAEPPGQ